MNFRYLNIDVWNGLNSSGTTNLGYNGIWLGTDDTSESTLHIFKDESGDFHFAIDVSADANPRKVIDPKVNGLNVSLSSYLLGGKVRRNFIDIRCNVNAYLPEFTKVTKDICSEILLSGKPPFAAVNEVINKWIVFWNNQNRKILSEEEQIGLICELAILRKICLVNKEKSIRAWVGPFNERHDFTLVKATIEVKGTRSRSRTHTINGIDQLLPFPGKDLLFISFLVLKSDDTNAISLPAAIELMYGALYDRPDLVVRFNELLSKTGYSPLNCDAYADYKFLLFDPLCFWVDSEFPSMTRHSISSQLIGRISSIRYDVSLDGMPGIEMESVKWDEAFNE